MTPREFAEKYVVTPLEEYVCLVNDPRESSPMGRTFTVAYLGNVVDAPPIKYLNVDIQFMKDITLRMLQDGKPVWMGCDTGKQMHRDLGLWDAELFDYEGVYGADFGLDKAARLEYHQTRMTHAMMFTGVDVVERQPRRWRVENSWDSKVGDKGFFLMNDSWFAEYMFEIAVPKDYLPAELQEALEQEPIVLPPWDPMGSLAHEQANASIEIDDVFRRFLKDQPSFEATRFLDALRAREYSRLDELNQVYLDYTGGGLYADSQIREHMELLRDGVFGNPHSTNPASAAATHYVEGARSFVLEYFNASPDEYVAIFTPNATGAIKLVGESYPFDPSSQFLLTFDNHNSVNGIREFARTKGAQVNYLPVVPPELRVDQNRLADSLGVTHDGGNKLFAYPAQSNFSGVQHPLSWIAQAQDQGWDVLVDCAAFVPTNKLDLSRWHPDFVPLSFYKMFGYPTGVGCLIARKSALAKLIKPWFAGGTITMASVQAQGHHLAEGEAAFEEGTVNYLNLPGVEFGLRHLESIGMEPIHHRVGCLTSWLLDQLLGLRHGNGSPLIRIYGPANMDGRGGVVTMNFYGRDGALIDHRKIEALANKVNISLRTGCFCNPGAGEVAHGLTTEEMERAFADGQRMTFEQFISVLESSDGKSAGAVRVSLGMVTNFADVYRFTEFARSLLN